MRIYSQYNCQNFQALHVNPKTLKRLGTTKEALLKNASIKDCIDRAEVTLKSKRHYDFKEFYREDIEAISNIFLELAIRSFNLAFNVSKLLESLTL